jgi:hypothetical protein
VNDLGRRYWVAKERKSPRLLAGLIGIGLVVLGIGYFTHRDAVAGAGAGLVLVFSLFTAANLRGRKP